jgi:oxygen-dependent protoporphyrinogen oxidase
LRVVVIGAGLAGLFTASELIAGGVDEVVVVDAAPEPGGIARTIRRDGFSVEPGAGSFSLPHPGLGPILSRAGVETTPARGAGARYVYVRGRLVRLARSPGMVLTPALPLGAKLRALGEVLVRPSDRDEDETVADFFRRRFGDRTGELVAWLMAAGVFAGDPERLSVDAAFPMLPALEREHRSVVRGALERRRHQAPDWARSRAHVPSEGMDGLADSLASSLGDRFLSGFRAESVRLEGGSWVVEGPERLRAETLVIALRPECAGRLIGGDVADSVAGAMAAPVVVVGLGGSGPSPAPDGLGALVGPGEGLSTLGVLFESSYAPSRAPRRSWLVKVIAGGATNPGVADQGEEPLVSRIRDEVSAILETEIDPDFVEVVRHRPGIPQYPQGHRDWLARLDVARQSLPGLHLTGWGYRGVGLTGLAADATRVSREIAR